MNIRQFADDFKIIRQFNWLRIDRNGINSQSSSSKLILYFLYLLIN